MRKFLLAFLALPVLFMVYLGSLLHARMLVRAGFAIGLVGLSALTVMTVSRPEPTIATAPVPIVPLTSAAFTTTVDTEVAVTSPATIAFSTPMERESVAAALRVEPASAVELLWSDDDRRVTIVPVTTWAPGTFHTITVEPGALAGTGRPLTTPVRASFLTREPTATLLAATSTVGERVAADSAFTVSFDGPVDVASARTAVHLTPSVEASILIEASVDGATRVLVTPAAALDADTTYRLVVRGVRDADGLEVPEASLEVRTVAAPDVVRFRPVAGSAGVPRDQVISVRFTRPMDRASTKDAFTVRVDGKTIDGTVSFAEDDTVLVFRPEDRLPYEAKVVATVAASARSTEGATLERAVTAEYLTVDEPRPTPRPATGAGSGGGGSSSGGGGSSSEGSGGGSVGSGSWVAVERYYLDLMNCTRTGGWVTSSGRCSSPGGRDVAALKLSGSISDKVARPYARMLATKNLCSHFIGGNPGDRLRKAGFSSYRWAENLGCRSGNAYDAVLASHRYFQSERDWSPQGGHYVNMMNRQYDRAGIGVWVASGRVRLVVVFYHP